MNTNIKILSESLNLQSCIDWVMTPQCGGVNVFIGKVRDVTKGKTVLRLEYEAYEKMALKEMEKIAEEALNKWALHKIAIHHRTGTLETGEISVVVAVSAAHRDAAFDACRYVIDTLKKSVPIWKKEVFEDGEVWVSAHP